jgi:hypothetical protein
MSKADGKCDAEVRCKASPADVCSLCMGCGWIIGGSCHITVDCPACAPDEARRSRSLQPDAGGKVDQ